MFWSWPAGKRFTQENMEGFRTAYKVLDETVSNSTTYQDDDDLYFSIGADETWGFQFHVLYSGTATGDIKFGLTFPASAVAPWGRYGINSAEAVSMIGFDNPTSGSSGFSAGGTGAANTMSHGLIGVCFNSGTAGTVRLQWAMQANDVGQVARVRKGSHVFAYRLD